MYNSISGTKEVFTPILEGRVGMYVCGPTVYNDVHIGNCRTFVSFDLIYRYLMYLGYKVRYVRNITDVGHLEGDVDSNAEDKISKKARLEQLEPMVRINLRIGIVETDDAPVAGWHEDGLVSPQHS